MLLCMSLCFRFIKFSHDQRGVASLSLHMRFSALFKRLKGFVSFGTALHDPFFTLNNLWLELTVIMLTRWCINDNVVLLECGFKSQTVVVQQSLVQHSRIALQIQWLNDFYNFFMEAELTRRFNLNSNLQISLIFYQSPSQYSISSIPSSFASWIIFDDVKLQILLTHDFRLVDFSIE